MLPRLVLSVTILICVLSAVRNNRNLSKQRKNIEHLSVNQFIRDKLVRMKENREEKKENMKILFRTKPRKLHFVSSGGLRGRFLVKNKEMENISLQKEWKIQDFDLTRKPKVAEKTEKNNWRWQAGWLRTT